MLLICLYTQQVVDHKYTKKYRDETSLLCASIGGSTSVVINLKEIKFLSAERVLYFAFLISVFKLDRFHFFNLFLISMLISVSTVFRKSDERLIGLKSLAFP